MNSFYLFFKESLDKNLSDDNKTSRTRSHHHSTDRMTKMGHRKSGKENFIAKSQTKKDFKDSLPVNQFLSWARVQPILKTYRIIHDQDVKEPYRKALARSGYEIYYYPDLEQWKIKKINKKTWTL